MFSVMLSHMIQIFSSSSSVWTEKFNSLKGVYRD